MVEGGRGVGGKMGVFGWPNPGGGTGVCKREKHEEEEEEEVRTARRGPRGGQGGSCRSPGQQTSSDPAGGSTRLN